MILVKKFLLLALTACFSTVGARITIIGDANATAGKTFSFNISQSVGLDNQMYVARFDASDAVSANAIREYSLSGFNGGNTKFNPLATPLVMLNGVADQTNPLIGQKISCLGLCKSTPVLVCNDTPSNVYWIASALGSTTVAVASITGVKDAAAAAGSVVKVAGSNSAVFAAVKPAADNFGTSGSGIALLYPLASGITQLPCVWDSTTVKSTPFDASLDSMHIGGTATITGTVFDMCWDEQLQRLYLVTKITGDTDGTDGAVGIMMGYLKNQPVVTDNVTNNHVKLILASCVDKTLFTGTDTIIGAVGASSVVALYKVRVMHTSTGLSYLIVVGNASDTNAQKSIYALPLVDKSAAVANSKEWMADATHGVIASKVINAGTNLKTYYDTATTPNLVRGRGFQVAPTLLAHLPVETDAAAKVGGAVLPGNIQDISIYKDTIFVSALASSEETAGVFYSQALFDATGAIKGWTPFKRVITAPDATTNFYGIHYAPMQGKVFALTGASSSAIDTVFSTTWGSGTQDGILGGTTTNASVGLNALLSAEFASTGGIQGLFDFPATTVGFDQTAGVRTSLMIATGYKKVVLVETGSDNADNCFVPRVGSFAGTDNKTFTEGSIDSSVSSNTYMITMSGGDLNTLGAITSAVIVKETGSGYGTYIVLGGTGGLAALRQFNRNGSTRNGWAGGLQKSFTRLTTSFRWELIGSYSNIKKLTHDGQNLYVLTPTSFDRVPLAQLHGTTLTKYTLATPASLGLSSYASFSDVIVSGDLALLATSAGLYRTGNAGVITTATGTSDALWTKISLSEGPVPVTQLIPLSSTLFSYDVAKNTVGGSVDVLAASVNQNLASVYRLAIADATAGVVSTTVQSIADVAVSGVTGPYAHLGAYKNNYTTDGALPLVSANQYAQKTSVLLGLPVTLSFGGSIKGMVAKQMRTIPFDNGQVGSVAGLVRNSATGSFIAITTNGLQILE